MLPSNKYSSETFDIRPFQTWLRDNTMMLGQPTNGTEQAAGSGEAAAGAGAAVSARAPPLSFVCGVWISHQYKFIYIRNRKTASSTFVTIVKNFMLDNKLCNRTAEGTNTCIVRMEPEALQREGRDVAALWRDYTVITSSRNPWARAASGYEFSFEKWHKHTGGCTKPEFQEFCRDPYIMGKLSNLFQCVGHREGVGSKYEGHWNFDFCHVEPVYGCMTDDAGKLVVDFVIRYERLMEDMGAAIKLINARRPADMPAILMPAEVKWRNKGTVAKRSDVESAEGAAYVYAVKYVKCGAPCVDALADFYAADLQLFGWERPGPEPEG
ncbi:hypothetical protein HYH03_004866 [Edaphochlamys debaryana]|uniref:Sulfotransferase n=1 Tax=Edaphochlamys debaryana TaxID=47281 RepID=A0A835Y6L8_9CHLO|nr:hypothetical protein HYH03_004866 [Edaphochlamys debaryana]|eukprot:KAG2497282.1 hypothetical protein HYH03_004866 [Edaphochlamys debaryana]